MPSEFYEKLIKQHKVRMEHYFKKAFTPLSKEEIKNKARRIIGTMDDKAWPDERYYLDDYCFLEVAFVYDGRRLLRIDYHYHELPTHLKAKMD